MADKDQKDMVRFVPAKMFNGHSPGSAFSCTRADAEAYKRLELGCIEGEEEKVDQENKDLDKPPVDKQVKKPPKKKAAAKK